MAEDDKIDDSELTIPLLVFDESSIKEYIKKEDLADFDQLTKRERQFLLTASALAQRADLSFKVALLQNLQLREMERKQIALTKWKNKVTLQVAKISGGIAVVGILGIKGADWIIKIIGH